MHAILCARNQMNMHKVKEACPRSGMFVLVLVMLVMVMQAVSLLTFYKPNRKN